MRSSRSGSASHEPRCVRTLTSETSTLHQSRSTRARQLRFALLALLLPAIACFPTFHTAQVDPGFRLDAGASVVADRARDEPADYVAYAAPAFGLGHRLEIGLPIGVYMQDGLRSRQLLFLPYAKLALHERDARDHVALIVQSAALVIPSIFGLRYGHDFGNWEPIAGVTVIKSGGPAGDDPVVTRYQQLHQSLIALSVGATWNRAGYPGIELGVLRNAFDENAYSAQGVPAAVRHTLYDLFIGMRISTGTLQQQAGRRRD